MPSANWRASTPVCSDRGGGNGVEDANLSAGSRSRGHLCCSRPAELGVAWVTGAAVHPGGGSPAETMKSSGVALQCSLIALLAGGARERGVGAAGVHDRRAAGRPGPGRKGVLP
mmetsp:Transcript_37839/g.114290  ORF Transcript_37839/g.114290 Transcript_37839/m.114290 type:complete len:114 (-) Transcript_37839:43-384(-)